MSEQSFADKRKIPRFALVAEAEITERRRGGSRLRVRISELGVGGCYVDTLNSLPPSTEILVRIEHGGVACELPGTVLYVHEGLGMGVQFGDVPADQRAILDAWLAEMAES
ncbi:MAG TPA: PilZ domain-containing protein [Methylomirabilota bacterium]|nr:PilZ domain-containing protein [Methylomirabilota bacterium]